MAEHALEGLRIIECSRNVAAAYAAKLLADMGAEIIKIEEPGRGDPARQRGLYPGHIPHPEKSGLFLYLNTNKQGVTLDLRQATGQDIFHRLLKDADALIHDYHPTVMASLGLDYAALENINPRLVMTSIAPFGLSGPRKNDQAAHRRSMATIENAPFCPTGATPWARHGLCTTRGFRIQRPGSRNFQRETSVDLKGRPDSQNKKGDGFPSPSLRTPWKNCS